LDLKLRSGLAGMARSGVKPDANLVCVTRGLSIGGLGFIVNLHQAVFSDEANG